MNDHIHEAMFKQEFGALEPGRKFFEQKSSARSYMIMLQPIEGYFDGKHIVPLSEIKTGGHYKVRITFLEELTPEEEVRLLASHSNAFEFWNDPKEDIYQDYLPNA